MHIDLKTITPPPSTQEGTATDNGVHQNPEPTELAGAQADAVDQFTPAQHQTTTVNSYGRVPLAAASVLPTDDSVDLSVEGRAAVLIEQLAATDDALRNGDITPEQATAVAEAARAFLEEYGDGLDRHTRLAMHHLLTKLRVTIFAVTNLR